MVSSPVFGIESLLDQVFATLSGFDYEVWMSHKGTLPTNPRKSNFENCLDAVARCDLFLAIITGRYGSAAPGQLSISHQELQRAIELNKPRWCLVHHNVTIARQLYKQFRSKDGKGWKRRIKRSGVLEDVRIIDMYDEAVQSDRPPDMRTANWAQEYFTSDDALRFLVTQFADTALMRSLVAPEHSGG